MRIWILVLIALAITSTLVSAKEIDCTIFSPDDIRSIICENSNYSKQEIVNLNEPTFGYVKDWNLNISNFSSPPLNVTIVSNAEVHGITIANAWIKMASIMPSVLYKGILYTNSSGIVKTAYGYDLSTPLHYFNGADRVCGSPGNTNYLGDCKTEYPNYVDKSYLEVKNNDEDVDNSSESNFTTNTLLNNFVSTLYIQNEIKRKHYKWERGGCCRWVKKGKKNICVARYYYCSSDYEDTVTDTLTINGSQACQKPSYDLNVSAVLFEPENNYRKVRIHKPLPQIISKIIFYSQKPVSYITKELTINYSLDPYNFLQIEALDTEKVHGSYSKINNSSITVFQPYNYTGQAIVKDFFKSNKINLSVNEKKMPELEVNISLKDDMIYLEVIPENLPFSINYGNATIENLSGNVELQDSGIDYLVLVTEETGEYQSIAKKVYLSRLNKEVIGLYFKIILFFLCLKGMIIYALLRLGLNIPYLKKKHVDKLAIILIYLLIAYVIALMYPWLGMLVLLVTIIWRFVR